MSPRLLFSDPQSAADALTFASRAARFTTEGVRLQASGGLLAMTAAALAPRGFGDPTPTVLALRTLAADPELVCDLVVEASALSAIADDATAVLLPDTALSPAWAGIAPPREGWALRDGIEASVLAAKAQGGIARVADAVPTDAGEDAVRAVRASVWGAPDDELGGLPLGVAFAALSMGFINGGETARVLVSGPWTRISLQRGHVIVRGPVATGLTAVRRTGTTGNG
ncbi:hypothetical protein [Microbacterium allomyrinae]|jgi:hypothetical protein|uniref:Uncharacterized protein n=1 Tax=Microbacterium allomyrinae TaxID=2830666 RepID=A0A9X1LV15_9MICO|nr:hypothetical protein [Microbacterium allomyrinae]MCC2032311.1 hypothetical protein [Microbacterium allomyrinae]